MTTSALAHHQEAFQEWLEQQEGAVTHVETHISHIFLTPQWAYKLKKPLALSFLDFSELETRRYYTQRELELNQRLAPRMYRAVWPVYALGHEHFYWEPPVADAAPVDYLLQMERMDESYRMDRRIQELPLQEKQVEQLVDLIADFHQRATPVAEKIDPDVLLGQYLDLNSAQEWIGRELGQESSRQVATCLDQARQWVSDHRRLLEERNLRGWIRDVHGDLHTRNIFLYDPPVIFDCIEFNDAFRQIDVLNDLAFLCMDLEAMDYDWASEKAWDHYCALMPASATTDARDLMRFYKSYRANVRLKIASLAAQEKASTAAAQDDRNQAAHYLKLLVSYWRTS